MAVIKAALMPSSICSARTNGEAASNRTPASSPITEVNKNRLCLFMDFSLNLPQA
jgi:hypothetical protein